MNYYFDVLKKYTQFDGRSGRAEYWYFFLFNILISIGIHSVAALLNPALVYLGTIYSIGVFLPSLAVGFRRLHDTGKSAWWILISLIPIIGALVLLFFLIQKGDVGENKYGADPKGKPTPTMSSV